MTSSSFAPCPSSGEDGLLCLVFSWPVMRYYSVSHGRLLLGPYMGLAWSGVSERETRNVIKMMVLQRALIEL